MATKHWRLRLHKDGLAVTLYTMSADEAIRLDLDAPAADSLIGIARQYHRHGQTEEQNHRDLAIGALMAYARTPLYDCDDARIEQVAAAPERPPDGYAGGGRKGGLVPVWEEPAEASLL